MQGALALEDALSKGLPIQKEIDALNSQIDGIDKDSLLGLVMASLPEDTLKNGTDTILQLNHKVHLSTGSVLLILYRPYHKLFVFQYICCFHSCVIFKSRYEGCISSGS